MPLLQDGESLQRFAPVPSKGRRDPEGVELLALALHLSLPVWSNDDDFELTGIEWYTTAEL